MKARFLLALVALSLSSLFASSASAQTVTRSANISTLNPGGGQVSITITFAYPGLTPTALGISIMLPQGWVYQRMSGASAATEPPYGERYLEFAFTSFPADAVTFSVIMSYPPGLSGVQTITGSAQYRQPLTNLAIEPLSFGGTGNTGPTRVYATGSITGGTNTFGDSAQISIFNDFANRAIYYSIDGSAPYIGGPLTYTAPFTITSTTTIRALGVNLDDFSSAESNPLTVTIVPSYALTVSTPGGGTVAKSPSASSYISGSTVTLTATPDSGWTFLYWMGGVTGTTATTTVAVNGAKSVQAVFGTNLSTSVVGSGTVLLSPNTGPYPYGSVVRLTPRPNGGSYFSLWGNAASGSTTPLDLTITQPNKTVSALFSALGANQVTLWAGVAGNGVVTRSPDKNVYNTGETVTLTAAPTVVSRFDGWTGDVIATTNPLVLQLNTSKSLTAGFTSVPNGTVVAWGAANFESGIDYGQAHVPVGLSGVTAIAATAYHTAALKIDGTVVAWGRFDAGVTSIPAGLSGVTAIAAGGMHTVALKRDGTVVAWGQNGEGQTNVPAGLNGVTAIAAGGQHTVALRNDGTVVAWGAAQSTVPSGLSDVTAITAGAYHTVALKSDGTVVVWGVTNGPAQSNVPAGLNGVTAISAGWYHTLVLRNDGTVVAWGSNVEGETNVPAGLNGVKAIAGGYFHSVALKNDGTVVAWGNNARGQSTAPVGLTGVTAIAAGYFDTVVLYGTELSPAPIITNQPFSQTIALGQTASFTVAASGMPTPTFQWLKNGVNISGATNATLTITNAQLSDAGSYSVVATNSVDSATSLGATLTVAVPVAITTQPQSQTSDTGSFTGSLTVAATGTAPITYQWQVSYDHGNTWQNVLNGAKYSGATAATLSASALDTSYTGAQFRCALTNPAGSVTSAVAALTINAAPTPPTINTQPQSQTVKIGATVSFTVGASSGSAMSYQWQKNGTNIGGANGATLTLPSVQPADGGSYTVIVTNSVGPTPSAAATLVVKTPPTITTQPASVAVNQGQTATFSVAATGTTPYSYQWRKAGVAIAAAGNASAISATLTLPSVQPGDAGAYDVIVQNSEGFATSNAATLSVVIPPSVSTSPADKTAGVGDGVTFNVTADGTSPFTHQWRKNGSNLGGQTNAALTLTNIQLDDAGSYSVVVSNPAGSAPSAAANLTVLERPVISTPPAAQPVNVGGAVAFSVTASGSRALTYQWRKAGNAIAGATNATHNLTAESLADAGSYDVVVGLVDTTITSTSSAAALTVNAAPVFGAGLPGRYAVAAGASLLLSAANSIGQSATLQWKRNGLPISGATGRTLVLTNFAARDRGYYQLVYADGATPATSAAVFINLSLPAAVFGWGWNNFGQATAEIGLANTVAIAAGYQHSLAVRADGTVAAWGGNNNGQSTLPAGLRNVVAVAPGAAHSLALRADGTVAAWGTPGSAQSTVPAGLANVVAIAAGNVHSLALKSDGTVVGWGGGVNGQDAIPNGLAGVVAIAAGHEHSLALKADGTLVAWGNGGSGRTTLPNGLSSVAAVAAGYEHNVALRSDGTVVAWGNGALGQTTVPIGLGNVVAVAAGYAHSMALKADGSVVAWGSNDYGQASVPAGLGKVVAIDARHGFHSLALHDASTDAAPVIQTSPVGGTAVWGAAFTFNVAGSFGTAPQAYQWRKGGVTIAGATSATYRINQVAPADAGDYSVVVTNYLGSAPSAVATLAVNSNPLAPAITTPPQSVTVNSGSNVTLAVAATGTPVPTYQWRRNFVAISSATAAALTIPAATIADGGYYDVVVTNSVDSAISAQALLKVVPAGTAASHLVIGGGYPQSGKVTISNTITYAGTASALGWQVLLPAGWSFDSDGGSAGEEKPRLGTTGMLEWAWTAILPSPVTFTYTLNKPSDAAGQIPLAALAIVRLQDLTWGVEVLAKPDPLVLVPIVPHTADIDRNFRINLTELTRVIELYNTRIGTTRTGRYKVQSATEDGFASDPLAATNQLLAAYHAADSDRNGALSLTELTRVIELYNTRNGTVRTGQYHAVPPPAMSEDGFGAGP